MSDIHHEGSRQKQDTLVDAYSRFNKTQGLDDKTTESVIQAIQQYTADCGSVDEFGYTDIEKICSDAGTQFISMEFQGFCLDERINLSLAAPKKWVQNLFSKQHGLLHGGTCTFT